MPNFFKFFKTQVTVNLAVLKGKSCIEFIILNLPESIGKPLSWLAEGNRPEDGDLNHGEGGEKPARGNCAIGVHVALKRKGAKFE